MKTEKTIGWLLIAGAAGVFIPYTILTIIFEYPVILRQETGIILTKFHEGGSRLVGAPHAAIVAHGDGISHRERVRG